MVICRYHWESCFHTYNFVWVSGLLILLAAAAAAAAKQPQSCPTLCDPIDGSLSGSTIPGILQARTLEWVAISFSNAWKWKLKVKSFSCVRLLATPWTAAYQAPPSMGFSRQEYCSGVPSPYLSRVHRLCHFPTVTLWGLFFHHPTYQRNSERCNETPRTQVYHAAMNEADSHLINYWCRTCWAVVKPSQEYRKVVR